MIVENVAESNSLTITGWVVAYWNNSLSIRYENITNIERKNNVVLYVSVCFFHLDYALYFCSWD